MNDAHQETTRKQVQDPVCKMMIDPEKAAAKIQHGDHTHYFCNVACKVKFEQDPKKYH
jgi:YHS domain-containing protein